MMFDLNSGAPQHILLADDDNDDCFLFEHALKRIVFTYDLTIVRNGEELLEMLGQEDLQLPSILFLDLNMPRVNGFECLSEIKQSEKLAKLPVIIFSTSMSPSQVSQLYKLGARYCIRKPDNLEDLTKVIYQALTLVAQQTSSQQVLEDFVLSPEFYKNENR